MASVYIEDILSQPARLRAFDPRAAAAAVRLLADTRGPVVLTGMGASLAALRPLWLSLLHAGRPAWLFETSELIASAPALLRRDTLLLVASQSGRSAEIVVAAGEARARGARILAVTNDLTSPLAEAASEAFDVAAGPEAAVSTKTFLNTLAGCHVLAAGPDGIAAAGDRIGRTADEVEGMLEDLDGRTRAVEAAFGPADRIYYLARGASLAAATYGALVAKEAAKWPVEAMSAPQFRHGPMELADGRVAAVVLSGTDPTTRDLNRALATDLERCGARIIRLGEDGEGAFRLPSTAAAVSTILEAVPLQVATLALAARSGVEAGRFRHLEKVTTVL